MHVSPKKLRENADAGFEGEKDQKWSGQRALEEKLIRSGRWRSKGQRLVRPPSSTTTTGEQPLPRGVVVSTSKPS